MTRRLTATILTVLVAAAALSGCAPQPEVGEDAAQDLQASVRLVAEKAAANDPAAAVTELDALQARLDEAVAGDEVSEERGPRIQSAIDLVRADLAQQIAANEAAAAAEAQRIADEQAAADQAAADKAAADKAAAEQAAEDAEDDDKPGKGNGPGRKDEEE